MTRDIEKLAAIGYNISHKDFGGGLAFVNVSGPGIPAFSVQGGPDKLAEAVARCKAHAQSPEGLKATTADKLRFLGSTPAVWMMVLTEIFDKGAPPEVAVDTVFWKVS